MMSKRIRFCLTVIVGSLIVLLLASCLGDVVDNSGKINVVATTTILGDVVRIVGGDLISLTVLLPVDTDPHSFQPTPRHLAAVADANLVFINGLGLEEALENVIESAVEDAPIVSVSAGVETISSGEEHDEEHARGEVNPHVWMDPNNVILWAEIIAEALAELDPDNTHTYAANAQAYIQELISLDAWIQEQVSSLPEENRRLVTDHDTFAYFIHRYSFELVGTINPGYSTLAEPSAQDIAELEDQIIDLGVPAVFVGKSVNPNLAERVAEDTGIQLVFLYTGSLSGEDGLAPTYLEMMRFNVRAMVDTLR